MRQHIVATINKIFKEAEQQSLRVSDVQIVGLDSRIYFILGGYLIDDNSEGTKESKGSKSFAKNEEVSVDKNDKKRCELCSNTGRMQKLMEQDIVGWGLQKKNPKIYDTKGATILSISKINR